MTVLPPDLARAIEQGYTDRDRAKMAPTMAHDPDHWTTGLAGVAQWLAKGRAE